MVNKWLKIVQEKLAKCLSFPCHCVLCLALCEDDIALCFECEKKLPWLTKPCIYCAVPVQTSFHQNAQVCGNCHYQPPVYEHLQALFAYQWPLHQILTKLKFGNQLHFAKMLGKLMSKSLKPITAIETVIAVPLHPKRQATRGFNQALEMAKIIARELSLPLDKFNCQRVKHTLAQTTLTAKKRADNMHHSAFAIRQGFKPKGVLVIEDVITTGATIDAFTHALKIAGVQTVEVWASCKTLAQNK